MAFWAAGGGMNPPYDAPLDDNNCHDRAVRPVVYQVDHDFDARPVPPPHFVRVAEFDGPPRRPAPLRAPRPDQTHVYFVLREHDARASSAPPSKTGPQRWSPGSALVVDAPGRHAPYPFEEQQFPSADFFVKPKPLRASPPPEGYMVEGFAPDVSHFRSVARTHEHREMAESRRVEEAPPPPLSDLAEADIVKQHLANFQRRFPDSKHERILRCLINPKSAAVAYPLDKESLENIFFAANEMFFDGRLTKRVTWKWSQDSSGPEYASRIAGHTSLRRSPTGLGFETCITLSTPILKDPRYSRRLLISAFLHELIHCYLFICCGFDAKRANGHTEGFRAIARLLDDWAGPGRLHLCHMEADLENFRHDHDHDNDHDHGHHTPPPESRKPRSTHPDDRGSFRQGSAASVASTSSSSCRRRVKDEDAYTQNYHLSYPAAMDGAWEVQQRRQQQQQQQQQQQPPPLPPPPSRQMADERPWWDYPALGAVPPPSEAGRGSGPSSYVY